jgi:DNA-binding protein HU-beta
VQAFFLTLKMLIPIITFVRCVKCCTSNKINGRIRRNKAMNKAELVDRVSRETKQSKATTETVLNSIIDTVVKTVKKGQDVRLVDFGTFCIGKRKERRGVNPQTGKEIMIPARKLPKFRVGRHFKNQVR